MLLAVRRFARPLLYTGSQPVLVLPTHDLTRGLSSSAWLAGERARVRLWETEEEVLTAVEGSLSALAGVALALDPHTLLLMFNPDTDEGAKLLWMSSQLPAEALAGVVDIRLAAGSRWIAGRDDSDLLQLLVRSVGEQRQTDVP
jgi:hypothetical protein